MKKLLKNDVSGKCKGVNTNMLFCKKYLVVYKIVVIYRNFECLGLENDAHRKLYLHGQSRI
jgi:hypothetical protein